MGNPLILKHDNRVLNVNRSSCNLSLMTQERISKEGSSQEIPSTASLSFVFSLIGGLLITVGAFAAIGLGLMGRPFLWEMGGMMGGYGMMGEYYYGASSYYSMIYGLEASGIAIGVLVIVFAFLMRSKPADKKLFGVLVLVFSLVSLIGMGGFFVGGIISLIGGVFALS
jgi:hypothetical protein